MYGCVREKRSASVFERVGVYEREKEKEEGSETGSAATTADSSPGLAEGRCRDML